MFAAEYISEKMVQYLLKRQYITEEHSSVYTYCIDYVLELAIFFMVLETISIFLGNVCIGAIFFLTVFLLWYLQDMPDPFWKIIFIIDNLFLYLAPSVTHQNRCFSQMQKKKQKRFRFVFLTIELLFFIVSSIFQIKFCYEMIALCVTIVVINMLLSIAVTYVKGGYSFDF